MNCLKDELFQKLLKKTEELGREVSHAEMRDDKEMPNPNNYAYYYGSFSIAAHLAYLKYANGGSVTVSENAKGVFNTSKKPARELSPERTVAVVSEVVDLFIKENGQMPSSRSIKKNHFISEEEVTILKENGKLNEQLVRKIAEEKSGRKFSAPVGRRRKTAKSEKHVVVQLTPIREEKEMKEEGEWKERRSWNKEQCEEILRKACRDAGHVLTQAEISSLAAKGELPAWGTLQQKVAPWFMWGDMFSVPYASDKRTKVASAKRARYLLEESERRAAAERFAAKQREFPLAEAPEEVFVKEEQKIGAIEAAETEIEPEVETEVEEEFIEYEDDNETVEYPIKLILPKGIRGTVRLTLKF